MITIEKENFTKDRFDEMLPLAQKCWNECSTIKAETCAYHGDRNFLIEPYFEKYQELADNNFLVLIALRDDAALKGFAFGFIYTSLHHKKVLCAAVDTLYIKPEFRSYAPVVVDKLEKEFKSLSAEIIGWPTHRDGPIFDLLTSLGYIADDVVMEKRLCV